MRSSLGKSNQRPYFSSISIQVSAYGFITEGHEHFSNHYYDKSWKKTIFYINHDFNLEKTLWKRLHDEGIIWLYKRPVTSTPKI